MKTSFTCRVGIREYSFENPQRVDFNREAARKWEVKWVENFAHILVTTLHCSIIANKKDIIDMFKQSFKPGRQ